MRPRNPTPAELKIVSDKVPGARAEIKAKKLRSLYEHALVTMAGAGSSTGEPTEEGYRETVRSYLKKYKKITIDGEKYDVGFYSSQTALASEMESKGRYESREERWGDKEVVINIQISHEETRASETYPIAAFTPESIRWAETAEDGETTWRELDIDNPDDEENLDIIRDTLDFLLKKS